MSALYPSLEDMKVDHMAQVFFCYRIAVLCGPYDTINFEVFTPAVLNY